jgi:hypothetical protein
MNTSGTQRVIANLHFKVYLEFKSDNGPIPMEEALKKFKFFTQELDYTIESNTDAKITSTELYDATLLENEFRENVTYPKIYLN